MRAIVDFCCLSRVLETPWMSHPYITEAVPVALVITRTLVPVLRSCHILLA